MVCVRACQKLARQKKYNIIIELCLGKGKRMNVSLRGKKGGDEWMR